MSITLGLALNQKIYPGAGDVDDCAAVAAIQAARAVGAPSPLPTVPQFRARAGVPDRPGPTGMNADQVLRGSTLSWPRLTITKSSTSWNAFRTMCVSKGRVFAVAVLSSKLPATQQYGFKGLHEISGRYVPDGKGSSGHWWIVNPLQAQGSAPRQIHEADLKAAILAAAGGHVSGVLFAPAPVIVVAPVVIPPAPPVVDPTPFDLADLDVAKNDGYVAGFAAGATRMKGAAADAIAALT